LLRQKDSALKPKLIELVNKQHFFAVKYTRPESRAMQATEAFRILGSNAAPAVPELMKIYDDGPYPYTRQVISQVLGEIGPTAKASLPTLLRALGDTNLFVRNNAAVSLGRIQSEPELAVPKLIASLNDPEPVVRAHAAQALGAYGSMAKPAIPALKRLLIVEQTKPPGQSSPSMSFEYAVSFSEKPGAGRGGGIPFEVIEPTKKALLLIDPAASVDGGSK
jgi:HEAT repeat protein